MLNLITVVMTIALIIVAGLSPAQADDDPDALLNYSFAVWIGSGAYKVPSADKRFAVLRPLSPVLKCRYRSMNTGP